jgi:predicted N-acyltransferase
VGAVADATNSVEVSHCKGWELGEQQTSEHLFLLHIYSFLDILEKSGSVCAAEGWLPQHLILHDSNKNLVAAVPMYLKVSAV